MMQYERIVVVGLGGIGSYLVEPLCRYVAASEPKKKVVLVDGDSYSRENLERQRMSEQDVGLNKAEVQCEKLRRLFPSLSFAPKSFYLEEKNTSEVIAEGTVTFSCVDNHATRKVLCDAVKRLHNGLLVSGGNDMIDGNVQVFARLKGRNRTPPIDQYHDEIKYPADRNPATMSCEELAELPSSGQIIFANLTAATLMLNAFYNATEDRFDAAEIYFDITTNKTNPRKR